MHIGTENIPFQISPMLWLHSNCDRTTSDNVRPSKNPFTNNCVANAQKQKRVCCFDLERTETAIITQDFGFLYFHNLFR